MQKIKNPNAHLLVALYFFILIIVSTYPLVFQMHSSAPGFFSTDESFAELWNSWNTKFSVSHGLSLKKSAFLVYPFGKDIIGDVFSPIFFALRFLLAVFFSPSFSYNLQVLFNIFLNAFFTYILITRLSKNKFAGFLGGVIFGFCPYIFVRSWQHLGETYLWPMVLFLWSLFALRDKKGFSIKAIYVLSALLLTLNYNVTYYAIVIFSTYLLYILFREGLGKNIEIDYVKRMIFLSIFAALFLMPQFIPEIKALFFSSFRGLPSAHNILYRPFNDLFAQSSRPLSYLLPSMVHPLFGRFTDQFIGSPFYGISVTEHTLYLGWVPLLFSLVALKKFLRGRRSKVDLPWLKEERFYLGFFLLLAVTAWFFSQPPWWQIGPLKIYMPSFFMYKIMPMFRAYCRFGIVVMFAVAVLAGFGLKFMLERFKSQRIRATVTALCCGLVLFEFWNWPPYKVIDVSRAPAAYYWLKEQPSDTVIAEYPLDLIGPNELYKLYQTTHEKRMINGAVPGTPAHENLETLADLSSARTAAALKKMGVKYVLVHRSDYLKTELIENMEQLKRMPFNLGLKFVRTFPAQECPDKRIRCIAETGPVDVYEAIPPD